MNDVRQKLSDAKDLLTMISHLAEKYSQGNDQGNIPWAGIKLTLSQASQIVEGVMYDTKDSPEQFNQANVKFEGINESSYEQQQSNSILSSSIAQRIKRMPASGGKIREVSSERQDNVTS